MAVPSPDPDVGRDQRSMARAASQQLRVRRLNLVLCDLGLDAVLPDGWITVTAAGVVFGDLGIAATERLVRRLESLADRLLPQPEPEPGEGQEALFPA